jgi:hypothetical protein
MNQENYLVSLIQTAKTGDRREVKIAQKVIEKFYRDTKGRDYLAVFLDEIKKFDEIKDDEHKAYFIYTLKWPLWMGSNLKEGQFEMLSIFLLNQIENQSGAIRQAVINAVEYLISGLMIDFRITGSRKMNEADKEKIEENRQLFGEFVDKIYMLMNKYHEPKFNRCKYISSLPIGVYKSLQNMLSNSIFPNKYFQDIYKEYEDKNKHKYHSRIDFVLPQIKLKHSKIIPDSRHKDMTCFYCGKSNIIFGGAHDGHTKKPKFICLDCAVDNYQKDYGFKNREVAIAHRRRLFDIGYLFSDMLLDRYTEVNNIKDVGELSEEIYMTILELARENFNEKFSIEEKKQLQETVQQEEIEKRLKTVIDTMAFRKIDESVYDDYRARDEYEICELFTDFLFNTNEVLGQGVGLSKEGVELLSKTGIINKIFRRWYQTTFGNVTWTQYFDGETFRQEITRNGKSFNNGKSLLLVDLVHKNNKWIIEPSVCRENNESIFEQKLKQTILDDNNQSDFDSVFRLENFIRWLFELEKDAKLLNKKLPDDIFEKYWQLFWGQVGGNITMNIGLDLPKAELLVLSSEIQDSLTVIFSEHSNQKEDFIVVDDLIRKLWSILRNFDDNLISFDKVVMDEAMSVAIDPNNTKQKQYLYSEKVFFSLGVVLDQTVLYPMNWYFGVIEQVWQDKISFFSNLSVTIELLNNNLELPEIEDRHKETAKFFDDIANFMEDIDQVWFGPSSFVRLLKPLDFGKK